MVLLVVEFGPRRLIAGIVGGRYDLLIRPCVVIQMQIVDAPLLDLVGFRVQIAVLLGVPKQS